MNKVNCILGVLFSFLFIMNKHICDYFFDYSLDWLNLRYAIYEFMFLLATIIIYRVGDRWVKMIFAFIGTFIIGSLVDKIFFNTYSYHLTDISVYVVSVALVVIIFNKTQNEVYRR